MMGAMHASVAPFVVLRGDGSLLVGHVAVGNAVAGLVQRRSDDPECSYTATALGGGEAVHGANEAGLACAALDHPGHPLVARLLGGADGVAEAVAMLRALQGELSRPVSLLLADASGAVAVSAGPGGVDVTEAPSGRGPAALPGLLDALRAAEPVPEVGATPAAGMAVELRPGVPPALHLALGPPSCSVFLRCWPGMELVPELSASGEGAPLARLAAAVAQATSTDADLRQAARRRLDRAEAEVLAEGESAERMAALMDGDTDDRGAAVRRLVGQSHAAELVRAALEELAVPAPPRGKAVSRPHSSGG